MAEFYCSSHSQDVFDGLTTGPGTRMIANNRINAFHWVPYGSKQYINKHQSSLISSNKIIIPKCQQIDVNNKSYVGMLFLPAFNKT